MIGGLAATLAGVMLFATGAQAQSDTDPQRPSTTAKEQSSKEAKEAKEAKGAKEAAGAAETTKSRPSAQLQALSDLEERHGNLKIFVQALEQTGLADQVVRDGAVFTAFAPTDTAFDSLGQRTDQLMRADQQQELTALLRNHLVVGDVDSELLRELDQALTVGGEQLSLDRTDGTLTVNGAKVVEKGIQAGNLKIYAIDRVLQPATQTAGSEQPGSDEAKRTARSDETPSAPEAKAESDAAGSSAAARRAQATRPEERPQSAARVDASAQPETAASETDARASQLIGKTVYGSDGRQIAEIDDLVIDATSDRVHAVLSTEKGAEAGEKLVSVPLEKLRFSKGRNGEEYQVALAMNPNELESQPRYDYQRGVVTR